VEKGFTLGWVYYKKNIFSRAILYLKEGVEKIPDNPIMRYHLGMAYLKRGISCNEDGAKEMSQPIESVGQPEDWRNAIASCQLVTERLILQSEINKDWEKFFTFLGK